MPGSPDRPPPAPDAVFVYGTLRPGRANWPVAAPYCVSHEPAWLPGYGLYALEYPVVAPVDEREAADPGPPDPGPAGVAGDLVRLRPDVVTRALARLDAFEGVEVDPDRSYYQRVETEVVTAGGSRRAAWLYVPGADLRSRIEESARVPGDAWPG